MHLSRVDKRVYAAVHDVVQNHDNQLIGVLLYWYRARIQVFIVQLTVLSYSFIYVILV